MASSSRDCDVNGWQVRDRCWCCLFIHVFTPFVYAYLVISDIKHMTSYGSPMSWPKMDRGGAKTAKHRVFVLAMRHEHKYLEDLDLDLRT